MRAKVEFSQSNGRNERKEESKSQKNLIAMKLGSIEQIAQASGLSVEEVLKLAEKN